MNLKQRWAMFAMGAWVAGTLIVSFVATENFYTVDRLLAQSTSDAFPAFVARLGQADARDLLRYVQAGRRGHRGALD